MLYGWLEVGASNIPIFASQSNNDIILRTTSSNNKIIIGNEFYNISSNSNINAALYISNNTIGINKIPSPSVQLDINGMCQLNDSITFNESIPSMDNKQASIVNSNNAFTISYNDTPKMYITDLDGINICDVVYTNCNMFAPAFNITSDSNLKRDISVSEHQHDLELTKSINVFNYRFHTNSNMSKGFIAQQVESVFPQCISKTMGYLKSSITPAYISSDGIIKLNMLPFTIEVGEKITISYQNQQSDYIVYKIVKDNVYVTGNKQFMGVNLFIIGKNGIIRNIDVNQLLALSFNSIKALTSRIETLEQTFLAMTTSNINTENVIHNNV